jgi:hypothetical protein
MFSSRNQLTLMAHYKGVQNIGADINSPKDDFT